MGHAMYTKMLQVSSMSILIFIKNIIERVSELLITKLKKKIVTIFLRASLYTFHIFMILQKVYLNTIF